MELHQVVKSVNAAYYINTPQSSNSLLVAGLLQKPKGSQPERYSDYQ